MPSTRGLKAVKSTDIPAADLETCVDCGKNVLASQLSLKCDACGFWHHNKCEKVSDDIYDFLAKHEDVPSILWFCKKCTVTTKKMMGMLISVHEHQQQLEDKLNVLGSTTTKRMDDLAGMAGTMDKEIAELTSTVNKKLMTSFWLWTVLINALTLSSTLF